MLKSDCSLFFYIETLKHLKKQQKVWWSWGRSSEHVRADNWNKNTFQGLISNIFTASHTVLSLIINKILTDRWHAGTASADQSEYMFCAVVYLEGALLRSFFWVLVGWTGVGAKSSHLCCQSDVERPTNQLLQDVTSTLTHDKFSDKFITSSCQSSNWCLN